MVFAIWLAEYHIIFPIKSIMRWMDRFVGASDTQESMDEDVKAFRRLGIHTGDEVENLFRSISRMTKEQAEQMRNIRRLSDSTMKMQDGLIITMADLVESRDSDTGAHVQKTAAYVKIIVEGCPDGRNIWTYIIDPYTGKAKQLPSSESVISLDTDKKEIIAASYGYDSDGRYTVNKAYSVEGKFLRIVGDKERE
jgi:hypothetical protein